MKTLTRVLAFIATFCCFSSHAMPHQVLPEDDIIAQYSSLPRATKDALQKVERVLFSDNQFNTGLRFWPGPWWGTLTIALCKMPEELHAPVLNFSTGATFFERRVIAKYGPKEFDKLWEALNPETVQLLPIVGIFAGPGQDMSWVLEMLKGLQMYRASEKALPIESLIRNANIVGRAIYYWAKSSSADNIKPDVIVDLINTPEEESLSHRVMGCQKLFLPSLRSRDIHDILRNLRALGPLDSKAQKAFDHRAKEIFSLNSSLIKNGTAAQITGSAINSLVNLSEPDFNDAVYAVRHFTIPHMPLYTIDLILLELAKYEIAKCQIYKRRMVARHKIQMVAQYKRRTLAQKQAIPDFEYLDEAMPEVQTPATPTPQEAEQQRRDAMLEYLMQGPVQDNFTKAFKKMVDDTFPPLTPAAAEESSAVAPEFTSEEITPEALKKAKIIEILKVLRAFLERKESSAYDAIITGFSSETYMPEHLDILKLYFNRQPIRACLRGENIGITTQQQSRLDIFHMCLKHLDPNLSFRGGPKISQLFEILANFTIVEDPRAANEAIVRANDRYQSAAVTTYLMGNINTTHNMHHVFPNSGMGTMSASDVLKKPEMQAFIQKALKGEATGNRHAKKLANKIRDIKKSAKLVIPKVTEGYMFRCMLSALDSVSDLYRNIQLLSKNPLESHDQYAECIYIWLLQTFMNWVDGEREDAPSESADAP